MRDRLAFALWLFVACGVVGWSLVLASNGLQRADGSRTRFWHHWEHIALGSELAYSILFFALYFFSKPSLLSYVARWQEKLVIIVSLVAGWGFLGYGWKLSVSDQAVGSGLYLLNIAMALFGLVDYLFGFRGKMPTTDPTTNELSSFKTAFLFTDIPVIFGFAAMGAYVAVLTGVSDLCKAPAELQSFVAGSIAFQLLASIIVFGILFRPSKEESTADQST